MRGADRGGCDLPEDVLLGLLEPAPGNHDPDLSGYRTSRAGLTLRAGIPVRAPWPDGAVSADGRVVEVAGLRVAGLGGCLRYSPGPNQYTDHQQARRAMALRARARWYRLRRGGGVDVLITHAPPRGAGDGDDPPHRGFTALHGMSGALRPALLLHGHVHPYGSQARPVRLRNGTTVRNVTGWHLMWIRPGATRPGRLAAARDARSHGGGDAG
jgi:hypothetical protein